MPVANRPCGDGCASHSQEFYRTQCRIKEAGKAGLKEELEVNHICKVDKLK